MTDPKEQQSKGHERDELELDAETIKDLELDEQDAKDVQGGRFHRSASTTCPCV